MSLQGSPVRHGSCGTEEGYTDDAGGGGGGGGDDDDGNGGEMAKSDDRDESLCPFNHQTMMPVVLGSWVYSTFVSLPFLGIYICLPYVSQDVDCGIQNSYFYHSNIIYPHSFVGRLTFDVLWGRLFREVFAEISRPTVICRVGISRARGRLCR